MRIMLNPLYDQPPCDACIYEGAAGCQDSLSSRDLRVCGTQINLCERHWKELRDVLNKGMPPDAAKIKEMPWADEIAAEKERSKWWK